jgi:hypothetical protein
VRFSLQGAFWAVKLYIRPHFHNFLLYPFIRAFQALAFAKMSPYAVKPTPPSTDPTKYDLHHQKFSNSAIPHDSTGWIERAAQVASILAEDVVVRDKEQKTPAAEVSLLKSSGLLKVLGPIKYGGGGQSWDIGYKVIREVAKGDG